MTARSRRCGRQCPEPVCRDSWLDAAPAAVATVRRSPSDAGRASSPGRWPGRRCPSRRRSPSSGSGPDRRPAPRCRLPYLLALGGSASVGFQPTAAHPRGQPTDTGYAEDLVPLEQRRWPYLNVAHLGCPGATTVTMLDGGGHCHYPEGTQLGAAEAFLRAHPTTVLVTVDLGFNDLLRCLRHETIDPGCVDAALTTVHDQLAAILAGIKAAAPSACRHRGRRPLRPVSRGLHRGCERPGLRHRQPPRDGAPRRDPAGGLSDGRRAHGPRRLCLRARRSRSGRLVRGGHGARQRRPGLRADVDVRPPAARSQPAPRRCGLPDDRVRHCRRRRRALGPGRRQRRVAHLVVDGRRAAAPPAPIGGTRRQGT